MKIWLKERIGVPELFTGRTKELAYFLNWTDRIESEISKSTGFRQVINPECQTCSLAE